MIADYLRSPTDRIIGQMGIALSGHRRRMPEEPSDDGKPETFTSTYARVCVAQIVDADIIDAGSRTDVIPRPLEIVARPLRVGSWNHKSPKTFQRR